MSYNPQYNPEPIRKPRRVWPWILLAVVLVFACGFGAVALLGAGAAGVDNAIKTAEADRKTDVDITACRVDKTMELVTVSYTIVNSSDLQQTYALEINVLGADETTIIGTAGDVAQVPAGGTFKGKAMGTVTDPSGKVSCQLVSA